MKRNRNHRDRNSTRSFSIFEPLENRRLMSGGELDPTFGQGGIASILPYNLRASDVAVQQDGKTVVVGTETYGGSHSTRFFTARFGVDGKLDLTFNGRGFVGTDIGEGDDEASAVAIQPDGKIVVVGTRHIGSSGYDGYYDEFAVARFNSNGTLDKTFDGDGKKAIRVKDSSTAHDVAIQSDGKIVIAGGDYNGGFSLSGYNRNSDFAAVRLNPNGSFDGTFGFLGKTTVAMGGWESAHAVTIDYTGTAATNPQFGKIILAGTYSDDTSTPSYMALARLNSNGSRDMSFDRVPGLPDTGYNIDPFPARKNSALNSVLMQPDGRIVVAGYAGDDSPGSNQFALARYDANGKLDKSFGTNGSGTVETGFGGADFGQELIQLHNGKLILAGTVNGQLALAAYDANGKPDTSFGSGGKVKLEVRTGAGLALAPDGRLLIAGGNDFITARLLAQKPKVTILKRLDASEAGPSHGMVTIFRDNAYNAPTRVYLEVSGSAILGSDYASNLTTVSSVASGSTLGGSGSGGSFGFSANVLGGLNNFLTFSGSGAGNIIAGGIGGIIGNITGGVINSNLRYIDIPAGQRSVNVPVTVNDDAQLEPHETATFTLAPDASYELAGSTQASVLIKDNDEVHINFQTANRTPPAGYAADTGTAFGDKGAGLFYGWDADNTANARSRNKSASPDSRYDTFNHMQKNGADRKWEIAVPNGLYIVRLVAGDPSATDSRHQMNLEGEVALDGNIFQGDVRWVRSVVRVQVNDGRLTLTNDTEAVNNKIAFIDIKAAPANSPPGTVLGAAVRQYSSATSQNWITKPNGLRTDNQRDEEIWI